MQQITSTEMFGSTGARGSSWARTCALEPGLQVSLVNFSANAPTRMEARDDMDCIHFSCTFDGQVDIENIHRNLHLEGGGILTTYAPGERFRLSIAESYRNVEVLVCPDMLGTLAGSDFEDIERQIAQGYHLRQDSCNPQAYEAAVRLARLLEMPALPRLLVRAALLEFVAWTLADPAEEKEKNCISQRERRLLLAARDRLLSDLSSPPTIASLARQTGLNQLKLKRGFKTVFGQCVYALFQKERMDHARNLLKDHSVTETAMIVGYSNISHFSSAFRKRHGFLPREVRRGTVD